MANIRGMKAQATQIKTATEEGANTAPLVGGLFSDIVDALSALQTQQEEGEASKTTVLVTPILKSGPNNQEIASITVNGNTEYLYAPKGGGSDSTALKQPLSGINSAGLSAPSTGNIALVYDGSSWTYKTLTDIYREGKNGQDGQDGQDGTHVEWVQNLKEGVQIATITIGTTEIPVFAPVGGGGDSMTQNTFNTFLENAIEVEPLGNGTVDIAKITVGDNEPVTIKAPAGEGESPITQNTFNTFLGNGIGYTPNIKQGDDNSYLIGSLKIGDNTALIYGLDTLGGDGTGQRGKSAYEIAVENGFVGTEAEWLASLRGAKGADGKDGAPGTTGPQGEKGDKGDTGSKGDTGIGISSIVSTYNISKNGTSANDSTPPADLYHLNWQASQPAPTNEYPYLWVKEVITYTDGTIVTRYRCIGAKGDKGETGGSGGYDDTNVKSLIAENTRRLDALQNELATQVGEDVRDLFDDITFLDDLFEKGLNGYSNFGKGLDSYLQTYFQAVGMYDAASKKYKWSTIEQGYNTLAAKVATLEQDPAGNYNSLISKLQQDIKGDTAFAQLFTEYAKTEDVDGIKQVIEWMYSGFRSGTNNTSTWADIVSAGSDGIGGAISNLHTEIDRLKNGYYISTASLTSNIKNQKDQIISQAGLVSKATHDSAIATLTSEVDGVKAQITTEVSNAVSTANIKADRIVLDGTTWGRTIFANMISTDVLTSSTGTLKINANRIDIDGLITQLQAKNATIQNKLKVGNDDTGGITIDTSSAYGYAYYTQVSPSGLIEMRLYEDGSTTPMNGATWIYPSQLHISNTKNWSGVPRTDIQPAQLRLTWESDTVNCFNVYHNNNEYNMYFDGNRISLEGRDAVNIQSNGNIFANSNILSNSDERIKDIVETLEPNIAAIANARVITYKRKGIEEKSVHLGSIAQDWQDIFPSAVNPYDEEGHLGLDYASVALASAVTAAREIVALKAKVAELESKLAN